MLSNTLQKFFDLKPNETRKALLLQVYIFLLITSLLIVKPTINSLFVSELTAESLPLAYLLTAIVAIVFSVIYDRLLWSYRLIKVILATLVSCAGLLGLFCYLLNFAPGNPVWLYFPYLFVAIFGLLVTSQFWILANMVFNVREAKRLFGFIGSGAIAGGIFGGYLTAFLTRFITSENLLLLAALLLLVCIPISTYLWKNHVHSAKSERPERKKHHDSPLRMIRKNRLLTLITATVGISVIVAKLVDYQYSHFAAEKIKDPESLTSFFGFWFSTLSVVSLVIQLFISKRILHRFGVGKSLMFLPLGILLGSVLLLLIPELWVVVLIKIADGSLKQSLNKAASELVIIPVPLEVRKHTKPFIDIVIDSIATGLAGAVLIFLINGLKIPSLYISYINIVLISVWVYLISRIFRAYLNAFRELLVLEHPKARKHEPHHLDVSDQSVYASVDRVLTSGKESQILYMLEETLENPDEHYFGSIRKLLNHPSEQVRALAVENLYYLNSEDLRDEMKALLNDPSDAVVIDVLRYLIHKDHDLHRQEILDYEQHSNHRNIKALTMLAVAREVNSDPHLKEILKLGHRVDALLREAGDGPWDDRQRFDIKAALQGIGYAHLKSHYGKLQHFLKARDPEVVAAAMECAGELKDPQWVADMARRLHEKPLREPAMAALRAYGSDILPELRRMVEQHEIGLQDALLVPEVLQLLGTQDAVSLLMEFIDHAEYAVSIRSIDALKEVKMENPDLEIDSELIAAKILEASREYMNLLSFLHNQVSEQEKLEETARSAKIREARKGLIVILGHRVDGHLKRIFKLLGIRYFEHEAETILQVAMDGDDQERANAIEFIDNLLDARLRHTLLPIIDSARKGVAYSEDLVTKLNLPLYTEEQCFKTLLNQQDVKIQHAVLYLIQQLGEGAYAPLVKGCLNSPYDTVARQAQQVLESLGNPA